MSGSRDVLASCGEITEYLELIERPTHPVCKETKQLAAYICKTFDRERLTIDTERLQKYMGLQKYFPFKLFPWEKCAFAMHNCVYREDGQLRWPDLLIYMGRGGGKNGYLAFEDFCLMTNIHGVKDYHIDIFANSEDQAKTTFDDIKAILDDNETKLRRFFSWNQERIVSKQTGSILRFRTANPKTKDGGRPGKVDFDELHQFEDYRMLTVAKTGLGKKLHPRSTIVTTDGDVRDGPLDHTLARAKQILSGAIPDNGLLPFLYKLDKKEEVSDPENWHKANPSLRYLKTLQETMLREYAEYKMDNLGNAAFMVKRMNIPQGSTETEVTSWENIKACSRAPKDIPTVWAAGIDFARTTDFVAVVLFGIGKTGEWVWETHSWVCSECKDLSRIKFPIQDAVEKGLITWVEDVEIPGELPAKWLVDQMQTKRIVGVGIDDYRAVLMQRSLEAAGFTAGKTGTIKNVKGRDIMRVAPTLIAKFGRQDIAFGDNPLMRWYINNAKQLLDTRGNVTFGKIEPKSRKTDGFMAAVMACTYMEQLELTAAMDAMPMDLFVF